MDFLVKPEKREDMDTLLGEYMSLTDEIIDGYRKKFHIDIQELRRIIEPWRKEDIFDKKSRDFVGSSWVNHAEELYTKLKDYSLHTLPLLFMDKDDRKIIPISRKKEYAKIIESNKLNKRISSLIENWELKKFMMHDFYHLEADSFSPFHMFLFDSRYFHFLHEASEETLEKTLKEYESNCLNSFDILNYPYKFAYELLGHDLESKDIKSTVDSVISSLKGRFCYLTYGHGMSVENNVPENLSFGDFPYSQVSFIYNTMKNAFKRAETLMGYDYNVFETKGYPRFDEKSQFRIGMNLIEENGKKYLACSQNFAGPDLYDLARKGLIVLDMDLGEILPEGAEERYSAWKESPTGIGFNKLNIGDITEVLFLHGLLGTDIKDKGNLTNSGTGLYGVRNLMRQTKRDVVFGYTKEGNTNFALQMI